MAYTPISSESIERFAANATVIGYDLNAADRWASGIHKARSTDTITRVVLLVSGTTGTRPTYRIGIESVDSSGEPTGTYLGATASAYADVSTLSNGQNIVILGETFTPTAGQTYATTIRHQSGTINGSNFQAVRVGYTAYGASGHPFAVYGDAAALRLPCYPALTSALAASTFLGPACVVSSITANNWGNLNTPVYRGISAQQGAAVAVQGVTFLINPAAAPFDTHFLINTDSTPLISASWVPGENIEDTGALQCVTWRFASPIECPTRAALRFLINPTSATAITAFPALVMASSQARSAFVGNYASLAITATTLGSYSFQTLNINPARFDISGVELPGFWFG